MPKGTKYIPFIEVSSDDLVVEDEDGTEHPLQPGGLVRFRKDIPWRATQLSVDMPNREYCEGVVKILTRQVLWWNWTDDEGEPLPLPAEDKQAFVNVLWNMGDQERAWLRDHWWEGANLPNE